MTTQQTARTTNDASQWLTPVNLPSMPVPTAPAGLSKWFNPLGAAHRLIGDVLLYRQHIKHLEALQQQMAHQAALMHHKIDADLKVALQTIEEQKNLLADCQRSAFTQLDNMSRDCANLTQAIVEISVALRTGNLNPEQTQACLQTLSILGGLRQTCGEQSLQHLTRIHQHTQQALKAMSGAHDLPASFPR